MFKARPATQQDFEAINGPMRMTSRASAFDVNGELMAVAGYYLQNGRAVIFSAIKPEARNVPGFPRTMLRFARQLLDEVNEIGIGALAAADPEIPQSDTLLKHLGFKHEYREVYSWPG